MSERIGLVEPGDPVMFAADIAAGSEAIELALDAAVQSHEIMPARLATSALNSDAIGGCRAARQLREEFLAKYPSGFIPASADSIPMYGNGQPLIR